jgi:plastocyanin
MPPGEAGAGGRRAVVEIRMTGNLQQGVAAFEPDDVTIAPGTTLRFLNISAPPHNVAFWPDSIPEGAAEGLNAALGADRLDDLQSRYLTRPNETLDLTFPADIPRGSYGAYCVPHLTLGMKMKINVQ